MNGRGRVLTVVAVATALVLNGGVVDAAPSEVGGGEMARAQSRFDEAEQRSREGDFDAAIAAFKEGLTELPEGEGYARARARALLGIVEAQRAAFQVDGALERLHEASRMLDQYIGALELYDDEGRLEAEQRRVQLQGEVEVIEAERAREAAAQAVTKKRLEAAKQRQRATVLTFSGVGALVLGAGGFGLMGAGILRGQALGDELRTSATESYDQHPPWICADWDGSCRDERLQANREHLRRGAAANAMVVTGAVAGGVLAGVGVTLVILGSQARGRSRALKRDADRLELQPLPTVTTAGAGVVLVGRF